MGNVKKIKGKKVNASKVIPNTGESFDIKKPSWMFDRIDKNGQFAFDIKNDAFNKDDFFDKILSFSSMTWAEIKNQTHDKSNKTRNHYLFDLEKLSKDAKERVNLCCNEEEMDAIFSFAFGNLTRVIGVKEGDKFHVIWYDPEHKFCPSKK